MVATQDGFVIAEKDLEIRVPESYSTRQAGIPEFKAADILRDERLHAARRAEKQVETEE